MPGLKRPALPPFERAALLIDLDGTLLDFAPTPDLVVVPPELPRTLRLLRNRLGDALAVITGRPVDQVIALLGDIPYAVAGEHGGAMIPAPGAALERLELPSAPEEWRVAGRMLQEAIPGVLCEEKDRGFVLHFRNAPAAGPALQAVLNAILLGHSDFALMSAHMAWEVKPLAVDKGSAVRSLMALGPFAGRLPIFIGDDVTDEFAIVAAQAMGGVGLRVQDVFGTPSGVRAWLNQAAADGHWPE